MQLSPVALAPLALIRKGPTLAAGAGTHNVNHAEPGIPRPRRSLTGSGRRLQDPPSGVRHSRVVRRLPG